MRKLKKQLFLAVENGDVEEVKKILAVGLEPNVVNNSTERITPLMVAVKNNQIPIIQLLLGCNANAEAKDFMNRDAFNYADKFGSVDTLFTLIKYAELEDNNHEG